MVQRQPQEMGPASCGAIHIELPGEVGADQRGRSRRSSCDPLRACVSARVMDLLLKEQGGGTRIWIAAGVTDMRRGFRGLAAQVQTALEQQPYSGHILAIFAQPLETV